MLSENYTLLGKVRLVHADVVVELLQMVGDFKIYKSHSI